MPGTFQRLPAEEKGHAEHDNLHGEKRQAWAPGDGLPVLRHPPPHLGVLLPLLLVAGLARTLALFSHLSHVLLQTDLFLNL